MIKAIPTRYAGCHFRSRLEARWAVAFDHLNIRWEYEPEGFEWDEQILTDSDPTFGGEHHLKGGRYLPDFLLPDVERNGIWFEVKGSEPTDDEYRLAYEFACIQDRTHLLVWGQIPNPTNLNDHGYNDDSSPGRSGSRNMEVDGGSDFDYALCVCPWCGEAGFQYEGRGARIHGYEYHDLTQAEAYDGIANRSGCWRIDDKCYTGNDPKILSAYAAARSARFEHGHRGAS